MTWLISFIIATLYSYTWDVLVIILFYFILFYFQPFSIFSFPLPFPLPFPPSFPLPFIPFTLSPFFLCLITKIFNQDGLGALSKRFTISWSQKQHHASHSFLLLCNCFKFFSSFFLGNHYQVLMNSFILLFLVSLLISFLMKEKNNEFFLTSFFFLFSSFFILKAPSLPILGSIQLF